MGSRSSRSDVRFQEWAKRVLDMETAMRSESDPAPEPTPAGCAEWIWWLEMEAMLNEIGITQVDPDD